MTAQDVCSHNRMTLQNLEKGDLVEFDRGLYSHWAVYAGDGKVIHLAGDRNAALKTNVNSGHVFTICGARFSKAEVKQDSFWDVTHGSKAYRMNDEVSPFKREEIVKRAAKMIGRDIGYNVLWNNCEHFASYCRYGQWESKQADKVFYGGKLGGTVALAAEIANAVKVLVEGISALGAAHAVIDSFAVAFVLDGCVDAFAAVRHVFAYVSKVDNGIFGGNLAVSGMKLLASVLQEIAGKNFMGGNFGAFGAFALRLFVSLF